MSQIFRLEFSLNFNQMNLNWAKLNQINFQNRRLRSYLGLVLLVVCVLDLLFIIWIENEMIKKVYEEETPKALSLLENIVLAVDMDFYHETWLLKFYKSS